MRNGGGGIGRVESFLRFLLRSMTVQLGIVQAVPNE